MSTPNKPRPADRLVLIANGRPYDLEPAEVPAGFRWAWSMSRVDDKGERIAHVVSRSAAGSYGCDCDGFKYRQSCRHVTAAQSTALHRLSTPAHRPPAGS